MRGLRSSVGPAERGEGRRDWCRYAARGQHRSALSARQHAFARSLHPVDRNPRSWRWRSLRGWPMPTITSDRLHALSRVVCTAAGSSEREASLVADHLVEANLTGHDSHGVGLLPVYVEKVQAGLLVPNRHAELVSDRGAVLVIEGNRGYGQVIGYEAMELGMARAGEQGVALLGVRNSFHLGRIGHLA